MSQLTAPLKVALDVTYEWHETEVSISDKDITFKSVFLTRI